jgi:hypothetical protein
MKNSFEGSRRTQPSRNEEKKAKSKTFPQFIFSVPVNFHVVEEERKRSK